MDMAMRFGLVWGLLMLCQFQVDLAASFNGTATLGASIGTTPYRPLRTSSKSKCDLTVGDWCQGYHTQPLMPMKAPPQGDKECKNNCNGVGVCQHDVGICMCPAGWNGESCEEPMKRPCTAAFRGPHDPVDVPLSHIDPVTKHDLNLLHPGWTASRCAGYCDDDLGLCFCGHNSTHRRIPPPPGSPPGTPPIQYGRSLSVLSQPKLGPRGEKLPWGRASLVWEKLYGPNGWCNSDDWNTVTHKDVCPMDGWGGEFCSERHQSYCPNQCTANGVCDRGFCKCHEGWYGHDCSRLKAGLSLGKTTIQAKPPYWLEEVVQVAPASLEHPNKPSRKRPFIYIYDLPSMYNAVMLQYAVGLSGAPCNWRKFDTSNNSVYPFKTGGYLIETALHEMLLSSPHRTFDPEEADFFYVPVYMACYAWPVLGWADFPWWHAPFSHNRPMHLANMMEEVRAWIQKTYPWWDRRQGRDHVWLAAHDEGACYMPTSIYNTSIVFSHWGRLGMGHMSGSAYKFDNYSRPYSQRNYQETDWREIYKGHPCYDPTKDLLIPGFKPVPHFKSSPLLGAVAQPRDTLLFFRGDVGLKREAWYSRGIRQKVYKLSHQHNWMEKYKIQIGTAHSILGDYSKLLARSKFCLAAPGDGYAMRVEDSVLHGCIPLIIMDGVHAVLESAIDYSQFSIRINESQIEQIPDILTAISPESIEQMQRALAKVWTRFVYTGSKLYRHQMKATMKVNAANWSATNISWLPADHPYRESRRSFAGTDAMATIMAWLYSRINATR